MNKKFARMTNAQKKVAIAKDVLKHLRVLSVRRHNTYCYLPSLPRGVPAEGRMQDHLDKIATKKCEVCAKGAMMLSHVRLFNKFDLEDCTFNVTGEGRKVLDIYDSTIVRELRKDGFTAKELYRIEGCFEVGGYWTNVAGGAFGCYTDLGERIELDLPEGAYKRLEILMKNIVVNKGRFCPEKLPQKKAETAHA